MCLHEANLGCFRTEYVLAFLPRSWLPFNTTLGEACHMTTAGDLPPGFLLGDMEDLVGYVEECAPESAMGGGDSQL